MLKPYKTKEEIPANEADKAIALADGTFIVDAPDPAIATELTDLRRKLEAADSATKKAARAAEAAELARKAAAEGVTGEALAKIRADVRAEVMAEVASQMEEGTKAIGEVRGLKLDSAVKAVAVKAGVRPERVGAWWTLNKGAFDLTSDGTTPVVKGKEGVSLEAFILTTKDDVPELFTGSKGDGGGAGGNNNGATLPPGGKISAVSNPVGALEAARARGAKE